VTGKFFWINIPEHLQVPAESGLVSLSVNNEKVPFPNIDVQGRMWLKQRQKEKRIEDRLKIDCFRLIEDAIPPRVEVSLFLDVAGKARQITLGPVYSPDRFIPLRVDSSLPAKLEQDGRLKVQVRPGRYRLSLALRHIAPLHDIEFTKPDHNEWPDREVWSFKARTDLRQVEISGASLIDPKQTAMPGGWQGYPAYLMQPGKKLMFKEIKRGDPNPAPDQLSLDRTLWLRFDGSGYFIQDRIKGKKNTNWRLEIDPSIHPGQVMVDGKEQLITREKDSPKPGIELRNGRVNILANSTFQNGNTNLPATGWDHDFTRVKGRLHLPPGWTLVNASGMDQIPRTWIKKWTLLDFFMVLIFTIALAKLYSKPLAAFAFVTLVLIFHEPNAPKYIWLALLLGFTLLKYLPDGRFKHLIRLYQGLAVLAFVVIVIPYSIQALRIGIYPQLAQPWTSMTEYASRSQARQPAPMEADSMQQVVRPMVKETVRMEPAKRIREKGKDMLMSTAGSAANTYQEAKVMQYDPKALTQTGPGMPLWPPFETVNFSWSGPVTRDQAVSFYLIGPKTNLILAFVRVGLIMLLAMGMFGISYSRGTGMKAQGLKKLVPALALILVCLAPVPSSASEIPPAHLLEELENRLLKKDDCFNACADLSSAKITLSRDRLSIKAQVDAGIDTAIPIPGDDKQWLASKIHINGSPAQGVFRKNGRLWLVIPKGIHTISMAGQVRSQGSFQLVFHLRPRHLDIKVEGWTAEGLHADGSFDSLIQFRRIIKSENKEKEILETGVLPSFARIERTLLLGMVWKVQTRVTREGDLGSGMVLDIPLLPKESITTPGIRVEGEKAKINFRAGQRSLFWESFLTPSDQIKLTHINTKDWAEIWKVDVSPIYHMEYSGIPVIFHKTGDRWYPTWYPWPGESVALSITRPAGIDGQTLTIEKSLLKLEPGRTSTNAILNLSIKSSQGGRHTITLPSG
ncbi:MAG: hypothetical protein MI892_00375, partial [Desulfobacterales bacterium]|nr:hypothetical protein [Desulfobacterales bacterium]